MADNWKRELFKQMGFALQEVIYYVFMFLIFYVLGFQLFYTYVTFSEVFI